MSLLHSSLSDELSCGFYFRAGVKIDAVNGAIDWSISSLRMRAILTSKISLDSEPKAWLSLQESGNNEIKTVHLDFHPDDSYLLSPTS